MMNNPLKRNPNSVYTNAMKDESKREQRENERLRKEEDRLRKNMQKNNKVLRTSNKSKTGNYTDSESDEDGSEAYEVLVVPQKPRSALEIYYADQKAKGSALSLFQMKLQWRKLSVDEKVMYENLALDDRLRVQHEKKMLRQGCKEGEEVDKRVSPIVNMKKKLNMRK